MALTALGNPNKFTQSIAEFGHWDRTVIDLSVSQKVKLGKNTKIVEIDSREDICFHFSNDENYVATADDRSLPAWKDRIDWVPGALRKDDSDIWLHFYGTGKVVVIER
ncbi:MAG: hypothetical protein ACOC2E_00130 [Bacteroidota bacterium]